MENASSESAIYIAAKGTHVNPGQCQAASSERAATRVSTVTVALAEAATHPHLVAPQKVSGGIKDALCIRVQHASRGSSRRGLIAWHGIAPIDRQPVGAGPAQRVDQLTSHGRP